MTTGADDAFQPSRPVTGAEAIDAIERLSAMADARRRRRRSTMTALTPANQLTLLRMLLIPAFVILVVYGYLGLGADRVRRRRASPTRSTA